MASLVLTICFNTFISQVDGLLSDLGDLDPPKPGLDLLDRDPQPGPSSSIDERLSNLSSFESINSIKQELFSDDSLSADNTGDHFVYV